MGLLSNDLFDGIRCRADGSKIEIPADRRILFRQGGYVVGLRLDCEGYWESVPRRNTGIQ